MSNICFFTNPWASGEIRGRQVAEAVKGIVDPDEVYPEDTLIYVKSMPPEDVVKDCKNVYVDVVDCYGSIPWLKSHSTVGVIAISRLAQAYLAKELQRDVVFIPEHNCNFERTQIVVKEPRVVGFCGYAENLQLPAEEISKALKSLGLDFVSCTDFKCRRDVVMFLRTIDIHLTFRPNVLIDELKNPLKLINAGSFGIPTVGYPEPSYVDECKGCFFPVRSIDEIVYWCDQLCRDHKVYKMMALAAMENAAKYHIDVVREKYLELHQNGR